MPHRDTSLAFQQAINLSQLMGTIWPGFINTGFQSALNTTQGHKPSYQQAVYIDPKWLRQSCYVFIAQLNV